MTDQQVQHGLEGVIAFETQIAEPDREGGALAIAAWISKTSSGCTTTGGCGVCSSMARSSRAYHRPNSFRYRCTPATFGSTCKARSPCSPRFGECNRSSTSPIRRFARISPAPW